VPSGFLQAVRAQFLLNRDSFTTGQTPVMKYNRGLMMAILHDRIKIAKAVNVELISLAQAPVGYQSFDSGVPKKFVIDPHHSVRN
jgi:glutathione-independent formaldehyde dehydrogenase